MARETWPAMLMITSSPAPDSESSVTRVWRLSCQRPFTPAFLRTLIHAVLNDVMGCVGSLGRGVPKANTNHSGRQSPNRRMYHTACASRATRTVSFSGITRPVPASVFDLPTVRCFLWTRSICRHRSSRNSLSRSPQFRSTTRAGYMFLLRNFAASASMRAFSSAVQARPGDGGVASFIAFSRRNFVRIRSPWSPQSSMPRKGFVAEWEGKPGRMPPRMGAAQRAPRLKGYATVLRRRINELRGGFRKEPQQQERLVVDG